MALQRPVRALSLALLVGAVLSTVTGPASASTSTSRTAQQVTSPFTDPKVFCKPHTAPAGRRNSSSPGVTPNTINITDMSIDTKGLRAFGADLQDFNLAYKAFFDEINQKCGGINGRKVNLRTAKYNPLAVDQAGHQQAICLKATEDQKALVVVGIGQPQIQRCVGVNHRSMMITNAGVPSRDFADSKGRLVSIYPGADHAVAAFVKDAVARRVFRGKKVAVLGSASYAAAPGEIKRQYVAPLERAGVDVTSVEILPCTGTVCTQGLGGAISRLRSRGINAIVVTHHITLTTSGAIFREMQNQNFRAQLHGPFNEGLHGDSVLANVVRTAGSDGARYIAGVGWFATNLFEVYNGWRIGAAKETPMARMCAETLGRRGDRVYQYNERDISNGRWGGTANICIQVRAVAHAIWTLGSNVTTDRLVAAMKALPSAPFVRNTGPVFRSKLFYSGTDVAPTKGVVVRFNFPCPVPRALANEGCFLPVDRPARVRNIA